MLEMEGTMEYIIAETERLFKTNKGTVEETFCRMHLRHIYGGWLFISLKTYRDKVRSKHWSNLVQQLEKLDKLAVC